MKIAYIVSMFPCWSETFILNELICHEQAIASLSIFSLKKFNEKIVHDDAVPFIKNTIYPDKIFNLRLLFSHFQLFSASPNVYISVIQKLLSVKSNDVSIKLKMLALFLLSPKYINAVKNGSIEHVHAHFATYPAILGWIIKTFTGIPFSVTAHAHDIYVNQDYLPIICKNADLIVTISEFNKNFILSKVGNTFCKDKIKVLHCGINLKKFDFDISQSFSKKKKDFLNILSIGRLSGIKGFPYLLNALSLLRDEGIDFNCDIIGDGPLRDQLKAQTDKLGITNQVKFLGAKKSEEIPSFLKNADVFVLACARDKKEGHDGIPIVFMEAMAYGTPVIGTKLSGIPELIKHNETGLCAVSEDSKSLKKQVEYFLKNQPLVCEMRQNARKLIEEEFDIEKISRQLREYFTEIIHTRQITSQLDHNQ